jgi:hypothetical protein
VRTSPPSPTASAGAWQWTSRYHGPSHADYLNLLAVSPDGQRILVAGETIGSVASWNYVTIAYRS